MKCRKCGQEATTGDLCDSCRFYETNAQCWRCQMYLPISEMQMYKGRLFCQYCIMDLREEEKATDEHGGLKAPATISGKKEKEGGLHDESTKIVERCERCGKELDVVYIFNDRRLCKNCVDEETKHWKTGGVQPPIIKFRLRGNESFFASMLRLLHKGVEALLSRKKKVEEKK